MNPPISIPPDRAIEVVEKHRTSLGCATNGHSWTRLDSAEQAASGQEYECQACAARGNLIRPRGVVYP